jgi:hypothetical protein
MDAKQKRKITKSESFDWVAKLSEKSVKEAYAVLDAIKEKYGENSVLEEDSYGEGRSYGYVNVTREETDAEVESRLKREEKHARESLERERRDYELLAKKFGKIDNPPKPMSYEDWKFIADPVYVPMKVALGNEDVINNFLNCEYKKYLERFKNV